MKRKVLTTLGIAALVTAAVVMCPATTYAQVAASTSFNVTATVTTNCSVAAVNINFGNYGPLGGNVDANGRVTVTCTLGTAVNIALEPGLHWNAGTRRMSDGTNFLNYTLYSTLGTTQWGNGTDGGATVAHTGTGAAVDLTVYGRIPGAQTTVPPGGYNDTVTVNVNF